MPKLDSAGQARRRREIINFIRKNGPVRVREICDALSMSRSSLFDDIKAINGQLPVLVCPKRGVYEYRREPDARSELRGKVDRAHVRRWFELIHLSSHPLSFEQLLCVLKSHGFSCSSETLYVDLRLLKAEYYVVSFAKNGRTYYRAGAVTSPDASDIRRYRSMRQRELASRQAMTETCSAIDRKLFHAAQIPPVKVKSNPHFQRTGKQNRISVEQLDLLQEFSRFPYANYVLLIPHTANSGECLTVELSVGIIIYSVETNRLYLLGRDTEKKIAIVALDRVRMEEVRIVQGKRNYCWHSPAFQRIFEEMFHLSTDDPVEVRVRFENMPYIAAKLQKLNESRKYSSLTRINGERELLYTDTIRGVPDFARYLRRYGRSAIAEEPKELADMMIRTSRKVIDLYEPSR